MELLEAIGNSGIFLLLKQSTTGFTSVLAFHSIGLAFNVGISTVIAMRVLGFFRGLPLGPLEDFCPLMTAGWWTSVFTGVVLLLMDPARFIPDATLYIKMGAIAVAMVLVGRLRAQIFGPGAGLEAPETVKRARSLSMQLLAVWGVAIVAGKVMAYDWIVSSQSAIAASLVTGVTLLIGRFLLGWGQASEQNA